MDAWIMRGYRDAPEPNARYYEIVEVFASAHEAKASIDSDVAAFEYYDGYVIEQWVVGGSYIGKAHIDASNRVWELDIRDFFRWVWE